MTTEELKIKLKEIKLKYYEPYNDGFRIKSTDRLFVEKLKTELDQLKSYPEIWDISSTEPFKYNDKELDMGYFIVTLRQKKLLSSFNRLLHIKV